MATNRYKKMILNGAIKRIPLVKLSTRNTDCFETYRRNSSSLDNLSYKYYNDSSYGWLILLANQEYGSMEYDIPDGSVLRIPYPLDDALSDYEYKVDNYFTKYGFN